MRSPGTKSRWLRKAAWGALLMAAACLPRGAAAAELLVSNATDIATASALAQPGDTLVMLDGVWTDADIVFSANGTAGNPITLRAQTLGRVYLSGLSRLRLSGNFLVVDGLVFTNGYRTSGEVISFLANSVPANNSRLINCAVVDYNPPNNALDTKWVRLYGVSNRVEYCYFRGKTNAGGTLIVDVDSRPTAPNYHVIARNYFGFRPSLGVNGGETMRIGDSSVSLNQSRTTVEENLFEQCNGDAEIVSSKSLENVFRHNTFVECEGTLCLRHGNGSTVEGNYFFGNRKPLTGGVRVVGENHRIFNNYFADLAGTASRAPLSIMQGLTNSPLNGYYQVKNATVAFNTFVNCTNSLVIGLVGTLSGTPYVTTLPPTNCTIANNIMLQPAGKIVDQRAVGLNFNWEGNILFGTTLGITNLGALKIDPLLTFTGGLWRPDTNSPALGAAQGTYDFVANDFEGDARTGFKDVGCDQASATPSLYPPLDSTSVGPLWMRTRGTFLAWSRPADIIYGTPLGASQLNASANAAGTFVYDPPAGTILDAGAERVLTVVFTPTDLINFDVATQSVTINISKATPVITWSNAATISYGTVLGLEQLNATCNVPGTLMYAPSEGTVLNTGNGQTLSVTFLPSNPNNYESVSRDVLINVTKVPAQIVWPNPAPIEQGVALGVTQLNATANTSGTFTYSPPEGTILPAGIGHPLTVTFVPNDTANYISATGSVTIDVTIDGKLLPTLTWATPGPILTGTALNSLQLNATADVPGTFAYAPPTGTVLSAGAGQPLTVTFTPADLLTYTTAVKTVSIDVALLTSNAVLRVAYIVPANRVSQSHAVDTLRNLLPLYQKFFADQMERNGFGRKTFTFETEPDGVTPLVSVVQVAPTDAFLRGDLNGNRIREAAIAAGLPLGAPGEIWWLIAETHEEQTDGLIGGRFDLGRYLPTAPIDSGWAISGSDKLALYQTLYQTNAGLYGGYILPELGPYPLVQDLSFVWFEGITLSGVSSSAVGAGLRSIGEALGLEPDFRNDENFNGNIMGFGFRGIRGVFHPEKYPYNYCGLSYASALVLDVNQFFNPGRLVTDLVAPSASFTSTAERVPVNGLLEIPFHATDGRNLHAAILTWQTESGGFIAAEMALSGTNFTGTFAIPYYNSAQTNNYVLTVFDRQGNRFSTQAGIYALPSINHSPEPFIRVTPAIVGLGEDVVLDAADTFDPRHSAALLEVEWDFDGDGVFDTAPSTELIHTVNYSTLGSRLIRARITDPAGDIVISAPVAVSVTVCTTSLSPTNRNHGYSFSTNTVTVTSGAKCAWTVVNTNDWITVFPDPEVISSGRWRLRYYTDPNPNFSVRSGTMMVGDQVFYITQDPAQCTFSVSPTNRFHGYGSTTSGTFKVSTKTNCTWDAISLAPWITIDSGWSGTNNGNVTYSLTENRVTGSRSGNIIVNGALFTVTQWGTNCQMVLSPYLRTHSENSETGMVTVSTGTALGNVNCGWSAVNTNTWITLTTSDHDTNSGSFGYVIQPNFAPIPRVGVLTVNEQSITIIQQFCSYSITPSGTNHGFISSTGSVKVTAGAVCGWSIDNPNDWITITSELSGAGTATVGYTVSANPGGTQRIGRMTIAGHEFTVTQSPAPCNYTLSPTEYTHTEAGEFLEIFVEADPGCQWEVVNSIPWLAILDGGSGEGPGTVLYTVEPNTGPARSGTLTIGPRDYNVSQASGIRVVTIGDTSIGSGGTNSLTVTLEAHGGENSLGFSLCFDTNLLRFVSAQPRPGGPVGLNIFVETNHTLQGQVGFTMSLLGGHSMPPGTGMAVQVYFAASAVEGKQSATVSSCDFPVPRYLSSAIGQALSANFVDGTVHLIGPCSVRASLDAPELVWTHSPIPWICQTNVTNDGDAAAMSGPTPHDGESYMQTTVAGPGTLSFWWRVSCEPNNSDRLRFYLDGSQQFQISGESGWEWRTFNVPAGSHVLRWRYTKNGSVVAGSDAGWVDQVVYELSPPAITSQPVNRNIDSGANTTFSVTASGQPPLTYQWLFNNIALSESANVRGTRTNTLTLTSVEPSQAGFYSVVIGSAQGNVTSTNATLTVVPLLPLPESLDALDFVWSTSGNAGWNGQAVVTHDGEDAGRSGTITHGQSSSFQTTISGPGTITFWWKVSSETNNDRVVFFVNGTERARISGEVDWQSRSFTVGSGSQTLLWTYSKNTGSTSSGQDRAWVDEIEFIPAPVSITAQPVSVIVDQGSTATFTVTALGTPPVSYQWMLEGVDIPGANSATLTIPNVQPAQAGYYSVLVNNVTGTAISSNALLQVNRLVPLAEALDAPGLGWTTNGTPPWVGQTMVAQDGVDAARSGRIGDDGTTSFRTTVAGPGTVSFWWRVSSQTNSDRLRFYIGSSEQQNISGEVNWTWRSLPVSGSGNQVLEWRYTKGASTATGQDSGWVDQIHYIPASTPTAPLMAIQPVNRTVVSPTTVSLNAVAIGSTPLAYQWYFRGNLLTNGSGISGATTTNLTITSAGAAQAGDYHVVVTNTMGSVTSASASLTVITAPVITNPPPSQNVLAGSTVTFNVGVLGMAPLSYQWMCNGTNLANVSGRVSGATSATLTLTGVQLAQEGMYSVLVSNAAGVAISSQTGGALTTWQAARTSAIADGEETALQALVTGPGTVRFSWKVSSETNNDAFRFLVGGIEQETISGEVDWRAESFEVPAGAHLLQWRYSKDATGSAGQDAGWVDGVEFIVTNELTAPLIATQPDSQTVPTGATIAFQAGAEGTVPLNYQWRFNGTPLQNGGGISGVKTPRLTLANVQSVHAGNYSLLVSNAVGTDTSLDAALTIIPPPTITAPVITTPLASQNVSENARVIFNVVAAGTPPLIYQWQFNGTNLADSPDVSGVTTARLVLSNALPTQAGNYSVLVSNALGGASATASLNVLSLADAAGAPYLDMRMAGYTSWVAQASANDFVRSGVIPDNQNTRLETWVDGPGTITFRWKVSSENVNDQLRFYIGAAEMMRISGEVDWEQQSFAVPAGEQQLLKWRYSKDADGAAGQDAAWVDDVRYVFTGTAIAPAVTNHPSSQSVLAGSMAIFTANVGGSFPLTYQWLLNGTNLPNGGGVSGAGTPRLTLTGVQLWQAGDYSLLVSNAAGTVTTLAATLSVAPVASAPAITSQPVSQTTNEGAAVSFSVSANGAAPLIYQWQFNGVDLADGSAVSGATTPTLTLLNVGADQIGGYSVLVTNEAGIAASAPASLSVLSLAEVVGAPYLDFTVDGSLPWIAQTGQSAAPQSTNGGARLTVSALPTISSQPGNRTVVAGNNASFTVGIGGTAPFNIQWRFNGTPLVDNDSISGANTTTLTLTEVEAIRAGSYSVVISNAVGNITSSNATLTVLVPPSIVSHPSDRTVNESAAVSFTVNATGTAPLTYRWRRNGTNLVNGGSISGATSATLSLNNAQPSQVGSYSVEVSNSVGTAISDNAQLTVIAAMTLGEAMNAPYLSWDAFIDTPWIVQSNVTHDGEAAAQSGNAAHGASTWLETSVTGPGTIRFWWKVSSQTNADWLTFSVGGSTWGQISGEVDWQKMSFDLPAGTVALRWTYSKNATVIGGLDRAWLDEVDFVPTTGPSVPVIVNQPTPQAVNPGTTVTLTVGALGTGPLSYQWRFNGQNLGDNENTLGSKSPTLTLFNVQSPQAGLYDVTVRNPYSLALSAQVLLDVIPVIPLGTALDTTNTIFWTTGGYSPWRGQTDYNFDRIDAAQSGPLPHGQSNWIQTILSGPGAITFWWKSSSETNRDRLRFLINGVEQANITGEVDWRKRTFPILLPQTELRWVYTKDASGSAGLDRGWVDIVEFGPSAPIITNASSSDYYIDQGSSVRLSVDATGTTPFSYQWQLNGTNLVNSATNFPGPGGLYGATGNHRLTISNAQPHQSGIYSAIVNNQAGTAIGPPMQVTVVPALPLGPALNTNLVWENGGYSFWVGTTSISRDGMAARNGSLDNGRSALMSTTVVGAGQLKFWWRASTETNLDYVTFSINSNEMARISGNHNWQQRTFDLNEIGETYLLQWEYTKNGTLTNGLDQVFVDQVTYSAVPPTITTQPISQTVDQGSTVTFTAAAQGTPPFIYQWRRGTTPLTDDGNISGSGTATLRITDVQVSQAGAYSLAVFNGGGSALTASAQLTVNPTFPLGEALDANNFTWSPGSPAWVGQSLVTHDGVDAARSPVIGSSQTATMQTTITGPGTISYWWKTSSETNRDYLIFYAGSGSTELARISGDRAWQQTNFTLPSGNQTLRWTYSKNGSTNFGQDRGWVDQFVFTPVPPTITSQPVGQTVDQGANAVFSVAASGTPPLTYQWRHDGIEIDGATSATFVLSNAQPYHAGNFSVVVANGGGSVTSANAPLVVAPTMPLEEALDGSNLVWTTTGSGSAAWIGQSLTTHDGVDSARIGGVASSGNASMQTSVTGPGSVTFWWKVSSEPSNDRLTFYTNNTEAVRISGEVNWQLKTFNLGPGTHAFRWTYSKNSGSTTGGQDRAWVDQVAFGPVAPTITSQPTNLNVDVGASATFRATVSGTPPFTYQWQFDGADLTNGTGVSGATSSNLVLSAVQLSRAGTYRVVVTGLGGTTVSADATLGVFPILTLAEALDTVDMPGLTWTTTGSPPWIGSGSVSHDGVDAARSGAIGNSTSNSMSAVVSGPITLSFWWKVSSETNDRLFFYVNGAEQGRISGEVDWQFKTVNLNSGNQTLKWTYFKNSGTTGGQDRGWVDQVSLGLVAPTITTQPANITVDSGAIATFTVGAAATPPVFYTWFFNGTPLVNGGGIAGATSATLTITNAQIGRVGSYSVMVSNSVGTVTSSTATLALSSVVSINQALDGGLAFTTGGTAQPWRGQQPISHDGIDAAQSGTVSNSTYSWIKTTVTGPGPLTFWWTVSSELDRDFLKFMVDGVEVPSLKISGEVPWQQATYNVPSGSHELQWRYSKNSSVDDGQDRGWVDQVFFGTNTPVSVDPPVILIQPGSQVIDAGEDVDLSVAAASAYPLTYHWLFNGTNAVQNGSDAVGATTSQLTLLNVGPAYAGDYFVIVSNIGGAVLSTSARLTVNPSVDLADAVDTLDLFVLTDGDAPWIGHTVVTHDGTDAARSGRIFDGQRSTIQTALNGPGMLTFWWKVSSQTNADALTFSINGTPQSSISGEVDWQQGIFNLPSGPQILEWTYLKNESLSEGSDRGWLDQLVFGPGSATNGPSSGVGIGISVTTNKVLLTWTGNAQKTYRVYYKNSLADTEWTLLDGEISLTWQIVNGSVVSDVVLATCEDVLAGPKRFYRVLEF